MTVESTRSTAAYTSVFVFLALVSFQLQGCSNGGNSAAMMSGACRGWCEEDQWTVENGQSHKERHCGGDMSSLCGGCDYCPSGDGGDSNDDAAGSSGDCCTNCAGRAYCSPQSLQCHDEKPWNKDYYLDCGGSDSGDASGSDGGDDCCNHCAGYAHCSPQSGQCHDEKPWNKDYYLDCGGSGSSDGSGSDSGGDSSGSCADQLNDYSQNNGACIAIKDNKVLLIQAQPYSTWKPDYSWDIPGGTNDHTPKEHTCEVAKRETAEEGQIAVTPYAKTSNGAVYLCRYEGPDTSHHSPEAITKRQWFTLEEFRNLELRHAWGEPGGGYRDIVEEALR